MTFALKSSHAEHVFDVEREHAISGAQHNLEKVLISPHTAKVIIIDGELDTVHVYGHALGRGGATLKKQGVKSYDDDTLSEAPAWVRAVVEQVTR